MLKSLLSSYQFFEVLKPKLVDEIQGPVSTPPSEFNMLEGIYGIMQLLYESDLVTEMVNVRKR